MLEQQTGKTLIRLLLEKQSDLDLHCLSRLFWQCNVHNFRTFTIAFITKKKLVCSYKSIVPLLGSKMVHVHKKITNLKLL